MKLVLDNIIFFLQQAGGGSVYWAEIIRRLDRKNIDITYVEPGGECENIFYKNVKDKLTHAVVKESMRAKILTFFPLTLKIESKFIFHSSYYRTSKARQAINIVTIHDFMPEIYFRGIKRLYHSYRKKKAISRADGIVCVSENTRRDLLRYYPDIGKKPITTIHLGIAEDYCSLKKEDAAKDIHLPTPYILYVGGRSSYKNFSFAVDVLATLRKFHFVIAGGNFSPEEETVLTKLSGNFTLIRNPDNTELNKLYNNAFCLLYPSSYEGFGIPVIEAMAAGCPVVALNISSIPEVASGAALLQNQLTISTFVSAILSLEDDVTRGRVKKMGLENAKKFSWEKSIDKLIEFYDVVYKKSRTVTL